MKCQWKIKKADETTRIKWQRGWQRLGIRRQFLLLGRCVEPIIRYYLAPVPAGKTYVKRLNQMQRRMVGMLLNVRPYPLEPIKSYRSRLSRLAAQHIENYGRWWAKLWIANGVKWLHHLERDYVQQLQVLDQTVPICEARTCFSWASLLLNVKPASWLEARRRDNLGNRTNTRLASLGKVHHRWEEMVRENENIIL